MVDDAHGPLQALAVLSSPTGMGGVPLARSRAERPACGDVSSLRHGTTIPGKRRSFVRGHGTLLW